jgi:alkyl hydroperoxide reductase subunit AhpC
MSVQLGDQAPDFTAETTEGRLTFHTWKGSSWAVLFSHPRDFTPVCTTELGALAGLKGEFEKRNTKVIGLSVDPLSEHDRWKHDIRDVTGHALNFPLIADPDRSVANRYGMIHPNASDTATVRSVFVIGPDHKVKLTLTYPFVSPTRTVVLRNPQFGNVDRLAFDRINRETRGGTLIMFADATWPKQQTMNVTLTALNRQQKENLLDFLSTSVGQDIGLLDHENRLWKGIVLTPDATINNDSRGGYTITLEFEGVLQ